MAQLENTLLASCNEEENQQQQIQTQQVSTSTQDDHQSQQQQIILPKKKRNQPGMPDPEAEVVALSPKALLATNRFICEICGKGFQRDQNLQLHRRGHNLPWKLRQRGPKETIKKRVYVCPEPGCVHHDPRRALGDLTGIKKHFCRKHGEKKWKCERCSKKYAVHSDYKAHLKTCGTREYNCDCGTIFSRRDSFLTHRAFCDVLAQESVKVQGLSGESAQQTTVVAATATTSSAVISPVLSINQSSDVQDTGVQVVTCVSSGCCSTSSNSNPKDNDNGNENVNGNNIVSYHSSMFAPLSPFSPSILQSAQQSSFHGLITTMSNPDQPSTYSMLEPPPVLSLSPLLQFSAANGASGLMHDHDNFSAPPPQPVMSATALLQKAAQLGVAASGGSTQFYGFGLIQSQHQQDKTMIKIESDGMVADRLRLPSSEKFDGSNPPMMDYPAGFFGSKPMTLDLLGLGNSSTTAFPAAYRTPIGNPINVAVASFDDGQAAQVRPEGAIM